MKLMTEFFPWFFAYHLGEEELRPSDIQGWIKKQTEHVPLISAFRWASDY